MHTPRRRRRFGSNPFELGVFSCNTHNGMAKLKASIWDNSWAHNLLDEVAVGMIDYVADAERLRDEILPRMERIGLRKPAKVAYA